MEDIQQYLNKFYKGTKNPSLEAMKYFMTFYNDFEKQMKFIHIAGTNGKGSCVQMIGNILINEGYKVGKFVSPHLTRYNERISINDKNISDEEMVALIKELMPLIEKYNEEHKIHVTLFELETIMGLLYFYRENVDFVILETGLGGLYDCTNIITNPLISLISSIGYDHMEILGNKLTDIAYQKAGIIKENSSTVVIKQDEDVNQVFIDICKQKNNSLHLISEEEIKNYNYDKEYQYFDYKDYKNIALVLKGKKQVNNAILCIESMKILNDLGYMVSDESIRKGLKTVVNKGRMEVLNEKPLIIFDGAHNEPAIRNFQNMVNMYYNNFKRVYVISILRRKNYNKMLQLLLEDTNADFILTSGNDENKYTAKEELYDIALKYRKDQKIYKKNLDEALEIILKNNADTVTFTIGSFYVYADIVNKISRSS